MLERRSSPHAGSHLTFLISLSVRVRSVSSFPLPPGMGVSMEMNHCSVARKITGLWQRQQCGYECSVFSVCSSAPRLLTKSTIGWFAFRSGNEPLLGGAEDHGIVAAPAVRIRVLGLFRMQQRPAAPYQINDRLVRVPHPLARVLRQSVAQNPLFVDVARRVEAVFHASDKVFGAVRRSRVDNAGSRIHGDVVRQHTENLAIEKWMLEVQALQLPAWEVRER